MFISVAQTLLSVIGFVAQTLLSVIGFVAQTLLSVIAWPVIASPVMLDRTKQTVFILMAQASRLAGPGDLAAGFPSTPSTLSILLLSTVAFGLAFPTISEGDVDANSPVSSTLMGKVRTALNWLSAQAKQTLFNNGDRNIAVSKTLAATATWETVESVQIYVPASAGNARCTIKCAMTEPADSSNRLFRAGVDGSYDTGQGVTGTGYNTLTFNVASPSSGVVVMSIQAKATFTGAAPVASVLWAHAYVTSGV